MKLEGNYSFEAPLDTVWQGLFDPEVLARTLPGCDKLERQGDQKTVAAKIEQGEAPSEQAPERRRRPPTLR